MFFLTLWWADGHDSRMRLSFLGYKTRNPGSIGAHSETIESNEMLRLVYTPDWRHIIPIDRALVMIDPLTEQGFE